ncbi:cation diffusion facilitator family transporter [Anoxynatronum sibiricum]|uniref:Cation diffusion facilitator family transporter n=1 Tax=Anoxynatronum sibiricum TaxID=210623 RepID=A0ABU9VP40_9CLOT
MEEGFIVRKLLKLSIAGTLIFAAMGIVWGIAANARIIMFDGLYSLVSTGMSLLSLWAVNFIAREGEARDDLFQFGRTVVEPLVMIIKSLVMLGIVVTAMIFAVQDLFHGGRVVNLENSLIYAVISSVFCLAVYSLLHRKGKKSRSGLLKLEAIEWKMDGLISLGTLAGFAVAMFLRRTTVAGLIPYVDPVLLLMITALFVKTPAHTLWNGMRELLRMAPDEEMQLQVDEIVQQVRQKYQLEEAYCRISKVGTTLYAEIDFVTGKKTLVYTVRDTDRIREEISKAIFKLPYEPWLTISFTENRKWAV